MSFLDQIIFDKVEKFNKRGVVDNAFKKSYQDTTCSTYIRMTRSNLFMDRKKHLEKLRHCKRGFKYKPDVLVDEGGILQW